MDYLKTAGIAACATLAACAPMAEPTGDAQDAALADLDTGRACFFTREINGYSDAPSGSARSDRLYISTGVNERWLLETLGSCPDLDFANAVGLDVRGSVSVCTGQTEMLLVPSTIPGEVDRCPVRVLGRVVETD